MRINKPTTEKQREASRKNAAEHATGPRSKDGRRRSSRNAILLGLFCKEVYVAEEDVPEHAALMASLEKQLQPKTDLRRVAVSRIGAAIWRCKLALRNESRYLAKQSSPEQDSVPEPERPTTLEWYGANPRVLANAIKLINLLIPDVLEYGRVREEFVEHVKTAFGEGFYQKLAKWEVTNISYLYAAQDMIEKAKMFEFEGPPDLEDVIFQDEPDERTDKKEEKTDIQHEKRAGSKPKRIVVRDWRQQMDMMVKLLEEKQQHLLDVQRIFRHFKGNSGDGHGVVEPPHRYVTAAARELERAIAWYEHLVEAGL
jgi:hypothetical protein